jgi:bidirectional [NiFe] hydrogenase diaphorase subunit
MTVLTLAIDGEPLAVPDGTTLLQACRQRGVPLPTLCHLDGLQPVGACRLCLLELEGAARLVPACLTPVAEGMVVRSDTAQLRAFRRLTVELLFAEGNHVCAVCVANGACELQDAAVAVGLDHGRLAQQWPARAVDASHPRFGLDHNRCILCTRCVRACDQLEGAHVWDVANRGSHCQIIAGLDQPWGSVEACTSCGHCVDACPTGALFDKQETCTERQARPQRAAALRQARDHGRWHNQGVVP